MASGLLHGHVDSRFEPLMDVIEGALASGAECGLSVTVDVDGRTVVDVHGGFADEARTRPWALDTIVNVWSTTKTVTSLAVLMLADRGLVDLDAPVAAYWPEFAANGKEQVLVRHLMSHSSGVAGWNAPFALTDMYDLERSTALLAAQAPWWEPGTASGYHALNFGHLLGEIVPPAMVPAKPNELTSARRVGAAGQSAPAAGTATGMSSHGIRRDGVVRFRCGYTRRSASCSSR